MTLVVKSDEVENVAKIRAVKPLVVCFGEPDPPDLVLEIQGICGAATLAGAARDDTVHGPQRVIIAALETGAADHPFGRERVTLGTVDQSRDMNHVVNAAGVEISDDVAVTRQPFQNEKRTVSGDLSLRER